MKFDIQLIHLYFELCVKFEHILLYPIFQLKLINLIKQQFYKNLKISNSKSCPITMRF
jgi:hypothetical protein